MPIDAYEDTQLAAVSALVQAAVRRDVDPGVLRAVYEDPRDLGSVPSNSLPAMAIYRHAERHEREHSFEYVDRVTIRVDYVLSTTSDQARTHVWPTLAKVWRSIAQALVAGRHDAIRNADGVMVEVLSDAEVVIPPDGKRRVSYGFAQGGGRNFPWFRAEVDADFWPLPDPNAEALVDFLRHVTVWSRPGDVDGSVMTDYRATPYGEATDLDFHVDDVTTLPGFSGS